MDLSRTEYPALLDTLQPTQATALLSDRVKHVGKLNTEIADWLQERRRIEELYAQALRKLAQKELPGDTSDLGTLAAPWQKVVGSVNAISEAHHVLALKIETDIERPLRDFTSSNREVQAMSTMQGNLQSMAKDYENAQKKADKLKDKAGKAGATKVASASSEMENASSQWSSQAPYVFEALQSLDESRINHLRDVLTQYQTHEADTVEKNRKTAENALNSILNIDTAKEIKAFTTKAAGSGQGGARKRPERPLSRSQASGSFGAPVPTPAPDDLASQRSASVHEEKKGRLGGLKRLGTVMRRKSTIPPPEKRASIAERGMPSNLGTSSTSNGDAANVTSEQPMASLNDWRPTSPGFGSSMVTQEPRPLSPPPRQTTTAISTEDRSVDPVLNQTIPNVLNGSSHQNELSQLQEEPTVSIPTVTTPEEIPRDSEGFSVPTTIQDPISQAEQEAASTSDPSGSQFKVDIRSAPITEATHDADSAMVNMANTLRAQAVPPRRTSTNRGRREARNTMIGVSAPTTEGIAEQTSTSLPLAYVPDAAAVSPFVSPPQNVPVPTISTPPPQRPPAVESSDALSLRSSRSTGANSGLTRHPNVTQPGLNSSIIETISVWLERGNVARSLVIGELALAYVQPGASEPPDSANIRLENFSAFEKVAPNPAFVTQSEDLAKPGEYTLNVGKITQTSGPPVVAFKYQVHVSEETLSNQAPIILTPSWKVGENETRVIVYYSVNPALKSPVSLSNVTISIYLGANESGTGKPTKGESNSNGHFVKERGMIYCRFDELLLSPGNEPQRITARFLTSGQAKAGKVEARWEMTGASSSGIGLGSDLEVSSFESAGASSDPFADESAAGTWKHVESSRKLVSGTYVAT